MSEECPHELDPAWCSLCLRSARRDAEDVTVCPACNERFATLAGRNLYILEVTVDGVRQRLIHEQSASIDMDPQSWTFPAGAATTLHWALVDFSQPELDSSWGDVLPITVDCRFAVPYHASPGRQDSVIIRGEHRVAPATTTSTSTTAAPTPEPPVTTWATTPIVPQLAPPTTVEAVTPPTAVAPTTTTAEVQAEIFTPYVVERRPVLPVTGGRASSTALFGLAVGMLGVLVTGLARLRAANTPPKGSLMPDLNPVPAHSMAEWSAALLIAADRAEGKTPAHIYQVDAR